MREVDNEDLGESKFSRTETENLVRLQVTCIFFSFSFSPFFSAQKNKRGERKSGRRNDERAMKSSADS